MGVQQMYYLVRVLFGVGRQTHHALPTFCVYILALLCPRIWWLAPDGDIYIRMPRMVKAVWRDMSEGNLLFFVGVDTRTVDWSRRERKGGVMLDVLVGPCAFFRDFFHESKGEGRFFPRFP